MVNEDVSRLSLDPAFDLGGNAVAFPLDAGLDLASLRPAIAQAGRFTVATLTPLLDVAALTLAINLTGNLTRFGLVYVLATAGGLLAGKPYRPRIDLRASRDAASLLAWAVMGVVAGLVVAPPSTVAGPGMVRLAALAFGLLMVGRVVAYAAIGAIRAHHLVADRTLIIGAGPISSQLATSLNDHPEFGLAPIGFLDVRRVASGAAMAVLGDYSNLARVVRQFAVRRVVIGFGRNLDLAQMVRTCQTLPVTTYLVARGADLGIVSEGCQVDYVMGLALQRVQPSPLTRPAGMLIKRAMDLAAASLMLALSAPLFLLAAGAVRLSSPGPILFRQQRIGRNGKPFDVLKLRSMRVNTDSDTTWSVARDSRVTAVGRILRKSSLDELPQLFNVLRGDMSLIGPRPERPHFVERFAAEVPHYTDRHRGPVGITGWAQVNKLRGDTSITERARLDNFYLERWTPWLDIVIALRTVAEILRGSAP